MTFSSRACAFLAPSVAGQFPWRALLAVGVTFGAFAAAQSLWPAPPAADADQSAVEAAVALAPARSGCPTCGVIETIARREATADRPAEWIFSVRLRDGSLRHSGDALRGRWQVGDGMQLIGGDRAWSLP